MLYPTLGLAIAPNLAPTVFVNTFMLKLPKSTLVWGKGGVL
jgi:hypothetical protein